MGTGGRSTIQLSAAGHPAGGHGIQTAGPRLHPVPLVQLGQGRLAARAGGHPGRGEEAGFTRPWVTGRIALEIGNIKTSIKTFSRSGLMKENL